MQPSIPSRSKAPVAPVIENEVDPSQLELAEQLQGLGIFAADIREELIVNDLEAAIRAGRAGR